MVSVIVVHTAVTTASTGTLSSHIHCSVGQSTRIMKGRPWSSRLVFDICVCIELLISLSERWVWTDRAVTSADVILDGDRYFINNIFNLCYRKVCRSWSSKSIIRSSLIQYSIRTSDLFHEIFKSTTNLVKPLLPKIFFVSLPFKSFFVSKGDTLFFFIIKSGCGFDKV
jgi:hypothetical protein